MIIDLSKWNYGPKGNTSIDFKQVRPQVSGCIIRAGNGGTGSTDPRFANSVNGCIANGIPWGAYYFAGFLSDPQAQVNKFMAQVSPFGKPSLPMVLDVETNDTKLPITAGQLADLCGIFLTQLEAHGFDTAIYMSPGFSWFLPKQHKLGKYKLWVADYTGAINPVNGWSKPWLHQYTDQGHIAGIQTNVDLNKLIV